MTPALRAWLGGAALGVVACGDAFTSSTAGDGGADVSTTESGPPTDAGLADFYSGGTDSSMHETGASDGAGPPFEGGPMTSYCAAHMGAYSFCEDFDKAPNVTQFLSSWTTFSQTGGTFSFDTTNVPSPPNALHVATTSTSGVRTLVIHVMPPPTAPVLRQRLEFDFLVDAASNIGALSAGAVAAILFGDEVTGGVVALAFGNGTGTIPTVAAVYLGPQPQDAGLPLFGSSNAPPPFPNLGQWDGRFAIEIQYPGPDAGTAGAMACAQLFIGGIAQLNPCLALPSALSHPATTTSIALGVYSGGLGNTGNIGVGFDNVTFIGQ